jgi:hypothetical protein
MDTKELAYAILTSGVNDVAKQNAFNRGPLTSDDIQAAADLLHQALAAQPAPTAEPEGFGDREPTDTERELFQCLDAFIKRADIKHDGPNLDRDARGVAALLSDSHPRGYASAEPADKFNRWYGFDVRRTGPTELTVTLSADTFDVFPHDEFMSGTDPVHEIFVVVVDVERKAACCVRAARVGNSAAQNEIDQGPSRDPTAALANLLDDVNRDMGRGTGWREFENPPAPVAGNLRAQLLLEGAADLQREALNLLWPRECGTLADCDDEPTPF